MKKHHLAKNKPDTSNKKLSFKKSLTELSRQKKPKQQKSTWIKGIIVTTLKENQAIDVTALNVKKLTDITDYMIVCTANSTTHVKTLIDKTCDKLVTFNIKPIGIEGAETREWMLVDFGHVILHVMLEPVRKFYSLEKLWQR